MTVQLSYEEPKFILQHIDKMMYELEALRQAVQSFVLGKSDKSEHSFSESLKTNAIDQPKRSVLDIIAEAPGQRLFQSSQEVEHYLAEERDSWDN